MTSIGVSDETRERRQAAAEALLAAERDHAPIASLARQWPEADIGDAYAIQRLGVSARIAAGATLVGHKIETRG